MTTLAEQLKHGVGQAWERCPEGGESSDLVPAARPRAAERCAGRGQIPALLQASRLRSNELDVLRAWLAGSSALRPEEARSLLERAIDGGQLLGEPALHWRAVKAHIAGDANWAPMGFKLILD